MTDAPFDPYKSPATAPGNEKPAEVKRPTTSGALLGAAILHLVPGLLFWSIGGFQLDFNTVVCLGGSLLLAALAIWARWMPLPPAIIGLIAYLGYLGAQLVGGMMISPITIILHGSILALLTIAVVSAAKRSAAPQKH